MQKPINPVVYFEIPVTDLDRAMQFYAAVFGFDFEKMVIDHNEMALFPLAKDGSGITGALAKGKIENQSGDHLPCRHSGQFLLFCPGF
jgi:hypothetical protein